jgi:hypothetical protein
MLAFKRHTVEAQRGTVLSAQVTGLPLAFITWGCRASMQIGAPVCMHSSKSQTGTSESITDWRLKHLNHAALPESRPDAEDHQGEVDTEWQSKEGV